MSRKNFHVTIRLASIKSTSRMLPTPATGIPAADENKIRIKSSLNKQTLRSMNLQYNRIYLIFFRAIVRELNEQPTYIVYSSLLLWTVSHSL